MTASTVVPGNRQPFHPPGTPVSAVYAMTSIQCWFSRVQEVQKNMPTRIAMMQPHCSSMIRSRSTSAAKASVTSG